jgi:hypothetical protein
MAMPSAIAAKIQTVKNLSKKDSWRSRLEFDADIFKSVKSILSEKFKKTAAEELCYKIFCSSRIFIKIRDEQK